MADRYVHRRATSGPLNHGQNPESRQQETQFRELLSGAQAVAGVSAYSILK